MPVFQIIGHRGARNEAPENTLVGFHHAHSLGLGAIETDIRLSRDGQLVMIHDATVDRTTTASGLVSDFTAAELAGLDARAAFPDWPEVVGIPTLEDALDVLGLFPRIQIEIKKDTDERMEAIAKTVLDAIRKRGLEDRVILSSFEPFAVEAIARLASNQQRAFIGAYDSPAFLETALRFNCSQADISLEQGSAEVVAQAHDQGLRVVGFQCNTPEALARALDWGMDGATSDVPSTILPLLQNL